MNKIAPYLLPSVADIFFVIIFIALVSQFDQRLLNDADTGYHIRAGEYIVETSSVPHEDIFSFLDPSPEWTAHEWLSEVIMAFIHKFGGLAAVVVFFAFILAVTYYLFFKILRKNYDQILLLSIIFFLVLGTSAVHFLARPHVFSLLFVVVWYFILNSFHYTEKNYLYMLPLLMIIWVNLHGAFIIGFVLVGVYVTGNFIYYFIKSGDVKQVYGRKAKLFFLFGFLSLLASLVNPYGYKILLFPFDFVTNKFLIAHVQEFLPTNFQEFLVYKYLFLIMLAVLATSRLRLNLIELFLVLGFTYMSLYSVRNVTMFAIIVPPIILKRLDDMTYNSKNRIFKFVNAKCQGFAETEKMMRGYLWPALAVGIVTTAVHFGVIEHSFDPEKKPVAAVEFLKQEHIPGNMFNNDEFGDYLIYAAYPRYRVFFDGRSDMYGVEHIKDYFNVIGLGKGWEAVLEKHNIKWIFFNANSLLSRYLLERADWHLIYADEVAHIYLKDIPEYQYLIEKYSNIEPIEKEDESDLK